VALIPYLTRGLVRGGVATHLSDDDLAVFVDRAVIDHADDGHTQVTPDAEGDAEAHPAQHSDDVSARKPEASAVTQGLLPLLVRLGSPILRELDRLTCLLPLFQPPAQHEPIICCFFNFCLFFRFNLMSTLGCMHSNIQAPLAAFKGARAISGKCVISLLFCNNYNVFFLYLFTSHTLFEMLHVK